MAIMAAGMGAGRSLYFTHRYNTQTCMHARTEKETETDTQRDIESERMLIGNGVGL